MSDFAKRLRNGPSVTELYAAADEIERLRAINAELLAALEALARPDGFVRAYHVEEKEARQAFARTAAAKAKGE